MKRAIFWNKTDYTNGRSVEEGIAKLRIEIINYKKSKSVKVVT
jgi:hypothetical protein